jgi:hypothetical protein
LWKERRKIRTILGFRQCGFQGNSWSDPLSNVLNLKPAIVSGIPAPQRLSSIKKQKVFHISFIQNGQTNSFDGESKNKKSRGFYRGFSDLSKHPI